jgi:hypothetical protein
MSQPVGPSITLSTQAFLILCRLFDGCYDDLKQQEHVNELVESIADVLLAGVQALEEQVKPPKDITFSLTIPQAFFLRKLVAELMVLTSEKAEQDKTRSWLQECQTVLEQAGMPRV